MAGSQSAAVFEESYSANSDLSAKQWFCMKYAGAASSPPSTDKVDITSAATDRCIGILQNKPASGRSANVRHFGISKAVSDGSGTAIAVGDPVGCDANGRVIKKVTNDFGLIGEAMDASAAQGTIIRVRLYGALVPFRTIAG